MWVWLVMCVLRVASTRVAPYELNCCAALLLRLEWYEALRRDCVCVYMAIVHYEGRAIRVCVLRLGFGFS